MRDLMDDNGNYSIDVLQAVLQTNHLTVTRVRNVANSTPFAGVKGYLIGTGMHWYAVAPVGGVWFQLDSLVEFPEPLDEEQFKSLVRGQHVFCVR